VYPPLVVGPALSRHFVQETGVLKVAKMPVQIACLGRDLAPGVFEDVLADPVPVPLTRGQHGEDQELDRLEREKRIEIGRWGGSRHRRSCMVILTIVRRSTAAQGRPPGA
jgi:hypothetical protein